MRCQLFIHTQIEIGVFVAAFDFPNNLHLSIYEVRRWKDEGSGYHFKKKNFF